MLEQLSMFVDEDEIIEEDFQIVFNDSIKVEYGDIFELGVHRLMCGDATIKADVEKLMGGCKVDLFLTDPPYNVDYGKTDENLFMMNDKMSDSEFRLFLRNAFYAADNVMNPGAAFYIWHANIESYNFNGACRDIEWKVRQCLIWNKSSFVMGRRDYHWRHEPCLYGWKEGAAHKWCSDRKQTTVMNFDKPIKSPEHPTMKPIELFLYQIKNNTEENDIILDSFAGSGTTLIAAEISKRISYNMELDPRFIGVIIRRWESFTGMKARKIKEYLKDE